MARLTTLTSGFSLCRDVLGCEPSNVSYYDFHGLFRRASANGGHLHIHASPTCKSFSNLNTKGTGRRQAGINASQTISGAQTSAAVIAANHLVTQTLRWIELCIQQYCPGATYTIENPVGSLCHLPDFKKIEEGGGP